ncbi:CRISPR-associated protein Cas5 [Brucepastera parasyntrophica]|uniref:CRISPR-associated protein Cas5 n=1 Tax=Brucepastera parasyntrophica TaxID=2880008 RepID=UPI00210AD36F|nr:CRISPR-associated protein Cas5 [Brucepastera parasyntrophica]ULQ60111.1 CRISPR-associated protein Cas5 [Brucepastera parasyntrophica]
MIKNAYPVQMEIAGNTAMWTRPDTGDSPVSFSVPTYSAVKGIFESVLWGPAVTIVPVKVEICAPLQFHSYYTNYGGPLRKAESVKKGNAYQLLATVMIDVCYRLYALAMPNREKAGVSEATLSWDQKTTSPGHAYQAIFERRLKRGQCHAVPCLGWKEFTPSYFGPFRENTKVQGELNFTIPSLLREVFSRGYSSPVSFVYDQNVRIENGILVFPERRVEDD